MGIRRHLKRSNLFLVRVWEEETADGSREMVCRGKLQRIVDGDTYEFSDWESLVELLAKLSATLPNKGKSAPQSEG